MLVPLPSPISELQHAPLPLLVLGVRSVPSSPHNFDVVETKAHFRPNLGLGSASPKICGKCWNNLSMCLFGTN